MVIRIWRGVCVFENADAYERHVTQKVFPALTRIRGHRGAYLLRRAAAGRVEFLAITAWDSMKAVQGFTGQDPDMAVVEPEAQAVLADFDRFVRHYDLVHASKSKLDITELERAYGGDEAVAATARRRRAKPRATEALAHRSSRLRSR